MKITMYILMLCGGFYTTANAQQKYRIQGELAAYRHTPAKIFWLFRDGDRKVYDSTLVKDGKFAFHADATIPTVVNLSIRPVNVPDGKASTSGPLPPSEGIDLMLDPGVVRIEGHTLRTAAISKGGNQQVYDAYKERMDFVGDSVYQSWKNQKASLPKDSAAAFQMLLNARAKEIKKNVDAFILAHPSSYVSFFLLQQSTLVIDDANGYEPILKALSPSFSQLAQFKIVAARVTAAKKLAIGQPAIAFSQRDDQGQLVSLSDVKGKYVLIDFWASWCGPCRMEYPYLKKAYAQYKDKDFEIIGISLDDKKALWLDAIKSNGFEWIQLSDLKGRENAVAKAYGVAAIPQNFLLDPQGAIIAKDLRGRQLEEKLKEVLK